MISIIPNGGISIKDKEPTMNELKDLLFFNKILDVIDNGIDYESLKLEMNELWCYARLHKIGYNFSYGFNAECTEMEVYHSTYIGRLIVIEIEN